MFHTFNKNRTYYYYSCRLFFACTLNLIYELEGAFEGKYIRETEINTFLLLLMGCLAACFYIFLKRDFVNKLTTMLDNRKGIFKDISNRRLGIIQKTKNIDMADIKGKYEYNPQLIKKNTILKESFLARLLEKEFDDNIANSILSSFDIYFDSNHFAVMLFCADSINPSHYSKNSLERRLELLQFTISSVAEHIISKRKHKGYMVEISNKIACIININKDNACLEDVENELLATASKIRKTLKDNHGIRVAISVSNIYEKIKDITNAYQEVMRAMEYKMLFGEEKIIFYKDITNTEAYYYYYYPSDIEEKLINCIKIGDCDTVERILKQVFENNFTDKIIPIEAVKCLIFDVTSTIIKVSAQIYGNEKSISTHGLVLLREIAKSDTIVEKQKQIIKSAKELCEYSVKQQDNKKLDTKYNIAIAYIENNYYNKNLNTAVIAQQIGITPAYLLKIFKEQSGQSLIDYIHKVRITKAKQLLKEQNKSIMDIADKVGYCNDVALIRAFKKYEGITPGAYRNLLYDTCLKAK